MVPAAPQMMEFHLLAEISDICICEREKKGGGDWNNENDLSEPKNDLSGSTY